MMDGYIAVVPGLWNIALAHLPGAPVALSWSGQRCRARGLEARAKGAPVAYDDEVLATGPVAFWLPEAAAVANRVGGRDTSYAGALTLFPGVIGTRSAPHCSGTVFTKRTYHGLYQTNLRGRADRLHRGDLRRLGGSSATWTGMRARPARPNTAGSPATRGPGPLVMTAGRSSTARLTGSQPGIAS